MLILCVHACLLIYICCQKVSENMCGGQKTTCEIWSSPSTILVLTMEFRLNSQITSTVIGWVIVPVLIFGLWKIWCWNLTVKISFSSLCFEALQLLNSSFVSFPFGYFLLFMCIYNFFLAFTSDFHYKLDCTWQVISKSSASSHCFAQYIPSLYINHM